MRNVSRARFAMSESNENRYDFYSGQYARFGSGLAAEIRREVYGTDFGQQGWRTLDEQDMIVEIVGERPSSRLLDVACGSGGPSLAIAFAMTSCHVTGVDIEAAGIAEANHRAVGMGLNKRAEFLIADCSQRLPFEDNSFDVVVCVDAVSHFADRQAVFEDWFRLLSSGGRLFLTDAVVLTGAVSRREFDIRASQGNLVLVPPGFNEAALSQAGFRLKKQEDTTRATADIANRTLAARKQREQSLQQIEGAEWFEKRQAFLAITADLAAVGKLSRFRYVADKPT